MTSDIKTTDNTTLYQNVIGGMKGKFPESGASDVRLQASQEGVVIIKEASKFTNSAQVDALRALKRASGGIIAEGIVEEALKFTNPAQAAALWALIESYNYTMTQAIAQALQFTNSAQVSAIWDLLEDSDDGIITETMIEEALSAPAVPVAPAIPVSAAILAIEEPEVGSVAVGSNATTTEVDEAPNIAVATPDPNEMTGAFHETAF